MFFNSDLIRKKISRTASKAGPFFKKAVSGVKHSAFFVIQKFSAAKNFIFLRLKAAAAFAKPYIKQSFCFAHIRAVQAGKAFLRCAAKTRSLFVRAFSFAAAKLLSAVKKVSLLKAASGVLVFTCAFAGITFMAVNNSLSVSSQEQAAVVSSNVPGAGLSTQILLAAMDTDAISVDFSTVSTVAAQETSQLEEVIETISDAVEEIEGYVQEASLSAQQYSEALESYEQACSSLESALLCLDAAQSADSSVLAEMYVSDVEALVEEAAAASEQAQLEAQEAKAAEEEAARIAAEEAAAKAAEEAAAAEAEAAAKAAEEEAAAKAAEEAAQKAAEEAAAKAAEEAAAKAAQEAADAIADSSDAASLRQALVDYACSFVGVLKYVSGGSSLTDGVDCSGFTSAVYAQFGYSLPHSSSAQAECGRSVSISEIKIGDIVCYSGHVGIYVGNGKIVHAPGSGRYVTISSMYIKSITDIRRIIE